jgi:hypothetical protein
MRMYAQTTPTSSYPDVLPLLMEAESDISADAKRSPKHAIVSINGKDLDEKMLVEREIA